MIILTEVYAVLIDSKGVAAFQPFTRQRWEKLQTIFSNYSKKSAMLFKIKLEQKEADELKWLIKHDQFMYAGSILTGLRIERGDAE